MDQVHVIRHKVLVEGRSQRQVAKEFGISRLTVRKYVEEAVPIRKETAPRARPVWETVRSRLEAVLGESARWTGGKQQLTATRLHELLLAEGHRVGVTLVKDAVAEWKRQRREVFVPLVATPETVSQHTPALLWLLAGVWLAGSAAALFCWWRQWLPVRAALRAATPVTLPGDHDGAGLPVMASPSMFEPGVIGIRRPVLLLPQGLVERLTPAQMNALVAHERCHVRCHDNMVAAMHMAVEMIFWFRPVVWWIAARQVDERERACDEAVLRAGSQPEDYAAGILTVCRWALGSPLMCVSGITGSDLRTRIETIMANRVERRLNAMGRMLLALAAVTLLGGPIGLGLLHAAAQSSNAARPDRINYQEMGANTWKHAPSLDAMHNDVLSFYLTDERDGAYYRLASRPAAHPGSHEQTVDFADRRSETNDYYPAPIVGKRLDLSSGYAFLSEPFDTPVSVAGTMSGVLRVEINKKDLDVGVVLYEVTPDGKLFHLTYFIGRASFAKDMTTRHLLTPGKVENIPVDRTRLVSRRLSAGSRLLIVLDVNKSRRTELNYGTGRDVSGESLADARTPLSVKWRTDTVIRIPIWK